MALRPCPECGKEISTTATKCPQCGASTGTLPEWVKVALAISFLALIAFFVWSSAAPWRG